MATRKPSASEAPLTKPSTSEASLTKPGASEARSRKARAASGGAIGKPAAPARRRPSVAQASGSSASADAPVNPRPAATASAADLIRTRAYYLSLERHGHGDPVADWLQAEREIGISLNGD